MITIRKIWNAEIPFGLIAFVIALPLFWALLLTLSPASSMAWVTPILALVAFRAHQGTRIRWTELVHLVVPAVALFAAWNSDFELRMLPFCLVLIGAIRATMHRSGSGIMGLLVLGWIIVGNQTGQLPLDMDGASATIRALLLMVSFASITYHGQEPQSVGPWAKILTATAAFNVVGLSVLLFTNGYGEVAATGAICLCLWTARRVVDHLSPKARGVLYTVGFLTFYVGGVLLYLYAAQIQSQGCHY